MIDLQRPVGPVHDVAGQVAQRAVAEIVPAVPFVRMEIGMEVAVRGRADPLVPVHARGHRLGRRARADAAIRAIAPGVRLGDLADDPAPHELAEAAITLAAMPLVAHLRRHLVLVRQLAEAAGLGNIVAERLLAIDALAQLHGDQRRRGMVMVGRGDENGVDLLVQLVEHAAVIGEGLNTSSAASS